MFYTLGTAESPIRSATGFPSCSPCHSTLAGQDSSGGSGRTPHKNDISYSHTRKSKYCPKPNLSKWLYCSLFEGITLLYRFFLRSFGKVIFQRVLWGWGSRSRFFRWGVNWFDGSIPLQGTWERDHIARDQCGGQARNSSSILCKTHGRRG